MKAVLDTNVLLSGLISPHGPPGQIVDLLRAGALQLVVDDRLLAEYREVLSREAFRRYFTRTETDDVLEYLRHESCYTTTRHVIADLPDPADAPFLELALTESAPLVTGNLRHFPPMLCRGARILTPRDFIAAWPAQ